jgi:hypothetical protein
MFLMWIYKLLDARLWKCTDTQTPVSVQQNVIGLGKVVLRGEHVAATVSIKYENSRWLSILGRIWV